MVRLDAIASVVADMAKTLAFYRLLGFAIPASADDDGFVSLDLGSGVRLSWSSGAGDRSAREDRRHGTANDGVVLVVRCASRGDVDAISGAIAAAGYTVAMPPTDAPWGARCCRVLDPDGIAVDLFAPFP